VYKSWRLFGAIFLALALSVRPAAAADWVKSQFLSDGNPVTQYTCAPDSTGPHPAVILLHGAGRYGWGYSDFERFCNDFAKAGYFADFIEYYSDGQEVHVGDLAGMQQAFPGWLTKIHDGIDALQKNPAVDPNRIALIGYSLGSYLATSTAALNPKLITAVVEYYGGMVASLDGAAATMPPTLIIHGGSDKIVNVAQAHNLDSVLTKAGRPHEMKIYPDANHAFNFRVPVFYNEVDAADAWQLTLKFLAQYLQGAPSN
jgi:dienelactone hydrolase